MEKISKTLVFMLFLLPVVALSCSAQKNSKATSASKVNTLMNNKQYTFVATNVIPTEDSRYNLRSMFPQGHNLYQLTSRYDLRITPDSVIAFLPFFGRSYTAPMDPTEGGIKFTSTKFGYTSTMRRRNYEITISPTDAKDVRTLFLTVSPSGFASLQVLSINRTSISFNGMIEQAPQK